MSIRSALSLNICVLYLFPVILKSNFLRNSTFILYVRLLDHGDNKCSSYPTKISDPGQNTRRLIRWIPRMRPKKPNGK
ncbi:hypothetical protein F4814DRAFT_436640 [Daldinia grandis]|nr:hypothetical protein F4814DRAFT_436640 [Daldinia grandis]